MTMAMRLRADWRRSRACASWRASKASLSAALARTKKKSGVLDGVAEDGSVKADTVTTDEAPSSAVVPKNLSPVCDGDHCSRRVATYTITEQNTPTSPTSAAARCNVGESATRTLLPGKWGRSGAATDAAYATPSFAKRPKASASRLNQEVR